MSRKKGAGEGKGTEGAFSVAAAFLQLAATQFPGCSQPSVCASCTEANVGEDRVFRCQGALQSTTQQWSACRSSSVPRVPWRRGAVPQHPSVTQTRHLGGCWSSLFRP